MKGSPPPISDQDLHAFIDGETEPAGREAILAFLAASPPDAARIETWRRQNETIRAAFASVEAEHIPPSWSLAPLAKRRGFPCKLLSARERPDESAASAAAPARSNFWLRHGPAILLAAAFASGVAATIGISFVLGRMAAPAAGISQMLGFPESDALFVDRTNAALRAFAPPAPAQAAGLAAPEPPDASQRPATLILPHLAGTGLKLSGVRVAPSDSGQIFCLFYTKASNAAVALCVEKAEDAEASGFRKAGHFPTSTIAWRQRGAKYALAGALAEAELRNLAERAHGEVEAFAIR